MVTLLIWIVVILAVIAIVRLIRVLELVEALKAPEDEITDKDNTFNARMMLAFLFVGFAGMIYFTIDAKKYLLPVSASKHGVITDDLMNFNFLLIGVVFFICTTLLFWFCYKYKEVKGAKAYFYPINHRLEVIWTVIPTIVLGGLIVYGLVVWNNITKPAPKNAMVIELYGKQFEWIARYAGGDNTLGRNNYRAITDENPLGVDANDPASKDDKINNMELHLPVNTPIIFKFHSRDVIHSAYFPQLRAQMNVVPGMTTEFFVETTITSDSMKMITKNPEYQFILLCNKVCGVAHFTMHMNVVVETQEQFKKWYAGQNLVFQPAAPPSPVIAPVDSAAKMTETTSSSEKIIAVK